jgi:hypothetical protein
MDWAACYRSALQRVEEVGMMMLDGEGGLC